MAIDNPPVFMMIFPIGIGIVQTAMAMITGGQVYTQLEYKTQTWLKGAKPLAATCHLTRMATHGECLAECQPWDQKIQRHEVPIQGIMHLVPCFDKF